MASGAYVVAIALQLPGVWIVTVATGHAGTVHFALQKGTVNKHLIENLTVRKVQAVVQQCRRKMIQIGPTGGEAFGDLGPAAVTGGTNFQPDLRISKRNHATATWILAVGQAWSMTALTTHTDLGKSGIKALSLRVEALSHLGGVTVRTHVVPVLAGSRPVQHILRFAHGIWLQVIPALAGGSGIPDDGQRLQTAVAHLGQVLLKGGDAKGVSHTKIRQCSITTVQGHGETLIVLNEGNGNPSDL